MVVCSINGVTVRETSNISIKKSWTVFLNRIYEDIQKLQNTQKIYVVDSSFMQF